MSNRKNRKSISVATAALALVSLAVPVVTTAPASADEVRQGFTRLVSHYPDGSPADGAWPSVSSDGRFVAFESFDNLTSDATDTLLDVFVKDMDSGTITRVPAAPQGWHHMHPSISGDGNKIAYISGPCCSPPGYRAYVYDRTTGTHTQIQQPSPDPYHFRSINAITLSRDARWAALVLTGSDIEAGEFSELAVSNAATGVTRIVSDAGIDDPPGISADGRFIAYHGFGVNLYDRDVSASGNFDQPGNTSNVLVSGNVIPGTGRYPSISDDGRKVAYWGRTGSVTGGYPATQVYVKDMGSQTTTLVSQSTQGVPGTSDPIPNWSDIVTAISGNGNFVAFTSFDGHLAPDLNAQRDVFVRELGAKTTKLVSYLPDGKQGVGDKYEPAFSQDGRFVAFVSGTSYDLTGYGFYRPAAIVRGSRRVFLRDLQAPCSNTCVLP